MKIASLKPGQIVYQLLRTKMGNTTLSTLSLYEIRVIELTPDYVMASWNGNKPQRFYARNVKTWKAKEPELVSGFFGSKRLKTKAEKLANSPAPDKEQKAEGV